MARKPSTLHTQPQPFNEKAHSILANVFDAAEAWLIRHGVCRPEETGKYLTMLFIKESGEFLEHASFYTESEGRLAAGLFLHRLPKGRMKAQYMRHRRICDIQLHWHTHYYFRDYYPILQQTYLNLLRRLPDLPAIDRNGVLMLAARTLDGAKADINRERRMRGADSDRNIVADDTMYRSLAHFHKDQFEQLANMLKLS